MDRIKNMHCKLNTTNRDNNFKTYNYETYRDETK